MILLHFMVISVLEIIGICGLHRVEILDGGFGSSSQPLSVALPNLTFGDLRLVS